MAKARPYLYVIAVACLLVATAIGLTQWAQGNSGLWTALLPFFLLVMVFSLIWTQSRKKQP